MLTICNADEAIRSVYRIACAHDGALRVETISDLKAGYHAFLDARQPALPINRSHDFFVRDPAAQQKLGAAFGPPPPNVMTIAVAGHALWLLVAWAYWVDRDRQRS